VLLGDLTTERGQRVRRLHAGIVGDLAILSARTAERRTDMSGSSSRAARQSLAAGCGICESA
jgi:hypothetical protein